MSCFSSILNTVLYVIDKFGDGKATLDGEGPDGTSNLLNIT